MSSRRSARRAAACILPALLAVAAPAVADTSAREEAAQLAEVNRRWSGARCRNRQGFWVKQKAGKDGWSPSRWLYWDESKGNSRLRAWFDDGKRIQREYAQGVVPVGTEFTARGWRVEKPGGSLFLELEEEYTGVAVKIYFWDDWVGRVSAKRAAEFERWARLNLFEVLVAADEVLAETAPPATAPRPTPQPVAPASGSPGPAPQTVGPTPAGPPELRVLGVAVEPLRAVAGSEIELRITYSVAGAAAGEQLELLERRTILQAERPLTTLEARVLRPSGTYESSQPLKIPVDLATGIYELRATVEGAGATAQGSTIFQVVGADG